MKGSGCRSVEPLFFTCVLSLESNGRSPSLRLAVFRDNICCSLHFTHRLILLLAWLIIVDKTQIMVLLGKNANIALVAATEYAFGLMSVSIFRDFEKRFVSAADHHVTVVNR